MNQEDIFPSELHAHIPAFETFLHKIGFKRNEGAIFGLLTLSESPLSSEQIEQILELSQSSVSNALKKLTHFGAIETYENRGSNKKIKLHTVKEDSLAIVATVFKKREQETIEDFKLMACSILNKNNLNTPKRSKRLKSIITTCEMSESIINFVIKLAGKKDLSNYEDIVARIPQTLDFITNSVDPLSSMAEQLKSNISKRSGHLFSSKLTEGLMKFAGDSYESKK
jgi:DNA-binding transcriptional regulator GbsR (MarR family)